MYAYPYLDEQGKTVFFEGEEAEHMVLATFGKRHQISEAVCVYGLSL